MQKINLETSFNKFKTQFMSNNQQTIKERISQHEGYLKCLSDLVEYIKRRGTNLSSLQLIDEFVSPKMRANEGALKIVGSFIDSPNTETL